MHANEYEIECMGECMSGETSPFQSQPNGSLMAMEAVMLAPCVHRNWHYPCNQHGPATRDSLPILLSIIHWVVYGSSKATTVAMMREIRVRISGAVSDLKMKAA